MTALGALLFVGVAVGGAAGMVWLTGAPERACVERATEWAYGPSGLRGEERTEFLAWVSGKGC